MRQEVPVGGARGGDDEVSDLVMLSLGTSNGEPCREPCRVLLCGVWVPDADFNGSVRTLVVVMGAAVVLVTGPVALVTEVVVLATGPVTLATARGITLVTGGLL